jgi:hypothetical protein
MEEMRKKCQQLEMPYMEAFGHQAFHTAHHRSGYNCVRVDHKMTHSTHG